MDMIYNVLMLIYIYIYISTNLEEHIYMNVTLMYQNKSNADLRCKLKK